MRIQRARAKIWLGRSLRQVVAAALLSVGVLFCLSFGAVLGDLCGAFIKRRLGMERGQKAPILDQYDFVIGAFLVTALFYPDWVYANYIEGWHIAALIFIIVIMFAIHRLVNIIGYRMGLKKEPW